MLHMRSQTSRVDAGLPMLVFSQGPGIQTLFLPLSGTTELTPPAFHGSQAVSNLNPTPSGTLLLLQQDDVPA